MAELKSSQVETNLPDLPHGAAIKLKTIRRKDSCDMRSVKNDALRHMSNLGMLPDEIFHLTMQRITLNEYRK